MVERERRPDMRPWALQGHYRLPQPACMLESETRLVEGDLLLGPHNLARELSVADCGRGRRSLTHPGEQRGNGMDLGGQIAMT